MLSLTGDRRGCDELHDACGAGEMLGCNDLYWFSPLASDDPLYACGERIRLGEQGLGRFCDEVEP